MASPNASPSTFPTKRMKPCVAVHGGAWKIPDQLKQGSADGCKDAASIAYRILEQGGSCIDAVTAAISCLEDNPCFDAGRGSVLNEKREIEMHAMIMRGDTCDVGGCIGLTTVKNPIKAARVALEETKHCLLSGETATLLARKHGVEEKEFEYFLTDYAEEEFEKMISFSASLNDLFNSKTVGHDTVGAVAMDAYGDLACGTSTGGITRQVAGRVSDSCLVGSGGFADNEIGAISTTGHGESIMKVNLARLIGFNMQKGMSPFVASKEALAHMQRRVGGCGGAITIDPKGDVDVCFNTDLMSWAVVRGDSKLPNGNVIIRYGIDRHNVHKEEISPVVADDRYALHTLRVIAKVISQTQLNLNGNRSRDDMLTLDPEEDSTPERTDEHQLDLDEMEIDKKRSRTSLK